VTGAAHVGGRPDPSHHRPRPHRRRAGRSDGTRHLTRSIPHVGDVAFHADPGGHERALHVLAGRSQTLLTFLE
jgi:hypothetical protein